MATMDELIANVAQWRRDKSLDDPKAQFNKVIEEIGEVAHELTRERYDTPEMVDSIGDTLVTVIVLSDILGIAPVDALGAAWDEISHRTGKTVNGTFIKDNQ